MGQNPTIIDAHKEAESKNIVFFDGVCGICNKSVDFLVRKNRKKQFAFAPLQSDDSFEFLKPFGVDATQLNSIVFYKNGKVYQKTRAVLEICRLLPGLWPLFYGFMILPFFLRDPIYNFVAKNRYKWFGKKEACRIPSPEERSYFIFQ